jgi:hypothetical protein
MSLYPGAPRWDSAKERCVLDDQALQQSMALAMEKAMKHVFKKVKGTDLPKAGEEDRWLLFVAISRGILQYLHANQGAITVTSAGQGSHTHSVNLNVKVDFDTKCSENV